MTKKFWISVVAVFVLSMFMGFIVHDTLLSPDYAKLASLFRPEADAQKYLPAMLIAHLIFAAGFSWMYLRGRETKPFVGQGLRFGAAVAVLTTIPMYLIYYAVQPMPEALVIKQIVFDTVGTLVLGVVVAWINR